MRKVVSSFAFVGLSLASPLAMAQPEQTQPPPSDLPPPKPPVATATVSTPTATATATVKDERKDKDDGIADHEKVVGKFGVAYFGINQVPLGAGTATAVGRGNVDTPVIGVRWWMKERLGLDLGLGFNFFSSGSSTKANNVETDTDGPAATAFALHGGVPLALAYGKHYKFLVVPEMNLGFAVRGESQTNGAADIDRSGFRFDIGARVGSEIQFGFIGIPELALQASVGLNFRHQRWSASQDASPVNPEVSSSETQTNFGTTVQSDPWALFTNSIAAIYYFP